MLNNNIYIYLSLLNYLYFTMHGARCTMATLKA